MPPKKPTTSRTKKNANLSQPILSFQSRKPLPDRKVAKTSSTTLHPTASESSIPPSISEEVHEIHVEKCDTGEVKDERKKGRRQLDVKSAQWDGLRRSVKSEMSGLKPIHAGPDTHNDVHHILRMFDMSAKYGPCVGVTRLQRWDRAKKWGLNPPEEIRTILTTEQGEDDPIYRENVLYSWLG